MNTFFAYGLNIQSPFPLEGLNIGVGSPDVIIRFGNLSEYKPNPLENYTLLATPTTFCRNWRNVGTFLFRNGEEVIIDPVAKIEDKILPNFVTGVVMACILHQRGYLVLHSSAVSTKSYTVGFMGDSGVGKSTTAAYLLMNGGTHLTDDALPIVFSENEALGIPGYPLVRLWADSIESLGMKPETLPKVYQKLEKRIYRSEKEDFAAPVPLDALFVIEENPEINIKRLNFSDSFIEVTRNSFMNRYLSDMKRTEKHFEQTKKLLQRVPVYKLQRPKHYEQLKAVASVIENCVLNIKNNYGAK